MDQSAAANEPASALTRCDQVLYRIGKTGRARDPGHRNIGLTQDGFIALLYYYCSYYLKALAREIKTGTWQGRTSSCLRKRRLAWVGYALLLERCAGWYVGQWVALALLLAPRRCRCRRHPLRLPRRRMGHPRRRKLGPHRVLGGVDRRLGQPARVRSERDVHVFLIRGCAYALHGDGWGQWIVVSEPVCLATGVTSALASSIRRRFFVM